MKKIILTICVVLGALSLGSCCGQPDLSGEWTVETIAGSAVTGVEGNPFLSFDAAEGRVHGMTGVNIINSTYTQDGNSLKFGLGATTMMAGPEEAMAVEQAFLKAFGEVASAKVKGESLELSDAEGNVVMTLARKK